MYYVTDYKTYKTLMHERKNRYIILHEIKNIFTQKRQYKEEIFENHESGKRLTARIWKQLLQFQSMKSQFLFKKKKGQKIQ